MVENGHIGNEWVHTSLLCNKNQMTGFYVIDIKTDLKLVKDILLKQNFSYRLQQLIMYVISKNVLNNNFFHRV